MNNRTWLMLLVVLGLGCGDSKEKATPEADAGGGGEDGGDTIADAGQDAALPPIDLTTPEGKKELRKRLLAAADKYSFDRFPETTAEDCNVTLKATGTADADALIEAVETAKSYDVICLSPGSYAMDKSIVISSASNLTIKGIGATPADTTLDFKDHTGDKGFDVTTPGFWIENLAVKNTIGNGVEVKAEGTADNPTVFRKLKVSWDVATDAAVDCGDADVRRNHGAYSVYPTKSSYVVVEFCEVEGASDAGLYVGQVEHGKVRHNKVHGNVAGLEVENSLDVVVYNNDVYDNSGGVLALQEPGLVRLKNEKVLIRDNLVHDNNGCNFAKPATTVANIPAGTGMMSFAGQEIEFRDNMVTNNQTTGLLIVSNVLLNLISGKEADFPMGYDPYAHNIYVNGNTFKNNGEETPAGIVGFLRNAADGFRQVCWDGFRSDSVKTAEDARICLGKIPNQREPFFVDITQDLCEALDMPDTQFIPCVQANSTNATAAHTCEGSVTFTDF